jgi:hypothetical protein
LSDGITELAEIDGLAHVAVSAEPLAIDPVLLFVRGCQNDDGEETRIQGVNLFWPFGCSAFEIRSWANPRGMRFTTGHPSSTVCQAWMNFSDLAREKQDSYPKLMTAAIFMSPKISYPEWQPQYQTALLETDREKLPERVAAAETAIYQRLQAISQSSAYQAERQAIQDAVASLRVLKRDSLGFPDWEKK